MDLKVRAREVKGVMILDFSGRLVMGDACATLRDEVRDALNQESKKILVNLAEVTYIDSAGLGELTGAYTSATHREARLKLLNLTKRVHDLMQITKLYTVFDVYEDESTAIASFS